VCDCRTSSTTLGRGGGAGEATCQSTKGCIIKRQTDANDSGLTKWSMATRKQSHMIGRMQMIGKTIRVLAALVDSISQVVTFQTRSIRVAFATSWPNSCLLPMLLSW